MITALRQASASVAKYIAASLALICVATGAAPPARAQTQSTLGICGTAPSQYLCLWDGAQWVNSFALNSSTHTMTLGPANGGTGLATLGAHGVLLGEGTSALGAALPGTSGYVLTSNGPSADPTWQAASGGVSGSAPIVVSGGVVSITAATNTALGAASGDNATLSVSAGAFSLALGHTNTWTATQTFPANSLTLAELPQLAGLSVLGVAGGSTANMAAITGAADQALIVNHAGSSLAFGTVSVAGGGTGLASGTSGGVPYFASTTTMGSSAALTSNAIMLGGGAGAAPTVLGSLGTTTTVLHGNASGAPTFGAVALATDVSGTLAAAQFPALTGDVTTSAGSLATTIAANAVTNAKAAQMAANTVKGNSTASTANAADMVMPSCSASTSALQWTTSTGFGCGTIAGGGPPVYTGTSDPGVGNDTTQGYVVGSMGLNTGTAQVFIARSVATGAAVWDPVSKPLHPGFVASNWYNTRENGVVPITDTTAAVSGSIYLSPFYLAERVTIGSLAARVGTTDASGKIILAIYGTDAAVPNRPDKLLANTATAGIATSTTGDISAALVSATQLEPGWYWLASQTGSTTVRMYAAPVGQYVIAALGSATLGNVSGVNNTPTGVSVTGTFGTLGNLHGSTFTEVLSSTNSLLFMPELWFQPSSVP